MLNLPKPLVFFILDGFDFSLLTKHAIVMANTTSWNQLENDYPRTLLNCSGSVVGFPDDQMGNSEVEYIHFGSGLYVPQDFSKVNDAIKGHNFFTNKVLLRVVDATGEKDKTLHIMVLLSSGGVHSHENQILAMVELAATKCFGYIYIHTFLGGYEVPPKSAAVSIEQLEVIIKTLDAGRIVSIIGRFYAMDRDKRWDRVNLAYDLIAIGHAGFYVNSAIEGLEAAYGRDETDGRDMPTAILSADHRAFALDPDDSVEFMNFRADRAREISQEFTPTIFDSFYRNRELHNGYFCALTEYHENFDYDVAFPSIGIKNGLGEVLSNIWMKRFRLAETEKYGHVTFFLNGCVDTPLPGENRILASSPRMSIYGLPREMGAAEATDHLVEAITGRQYDDIISNYAYANCDMVGHTGVSNVAILVVQAVAASLQRIVDVLRIVGGKMLVTAGQGNIEQMLDKETSQPHTAQKTNPVPLVYVCGHKSLVSGGKLSDLAPMMLPILGIEQPTEITDSSLMASA